MGKKKIDFEIGLQELVEVARLEGNTDLVITGKTLHKHVGEYPPEKGKHHAMASASDVLMAAVAKHHGKVLYAPPKGKGARLEVSLPLA